MKHRLLALDIDGTMLNSSSYLTARTKEAIKSLKSKGYQVTLVSGRRPMLMLDYARELEITAPIVSFNGALIYSAEEMQILERTAIPLYLVSELMVSWSNEDIGMRISTGALLGVQNYCVGKLSVKSNNLLPAQMANPDDDLRIDSSLAIDFDPMRLMVGGSFELTSRAKELAEEAISVGNLTVFHTQDYDGTWYFEILPSGVTKAKGLDTVCKLLGISMQETIAIGDQKNDIEMIKASGLGIAMGNAVAELKDVADAVIGHHDEDGLAAYLEQLEG